MKCRMGKLKDVRRKLARHKLVANGCGYLATGVRGFKSQLQQLSFRNSVRGLSFAEVLGD